MARNVQICNNSWLTSTTAPLPVDGSKQGDFDGVLTMQSNRKRRGPLFPKFEIGGPLVTGARGSLNLSSVDG